MGYQKGRGVDKSFGSTATNTPSVYLLVDESLPNWITTHFSSHSVSILSYSTLGLQKGASDETVIAQFSKILTRADDIGIFITSDRGKKDGVMPKVIEAEQAKGARIVPIYTSVRGYAGLSKTFQILVRRKELKDLSIADRFTKINLSGSSSATLVIFETKQGSKKIINNS